MACGLALIADSVTAVTVEVMKSHGALITYFEEYLAGSR
jgi:hypothetical protein